MLYEVASFLLARVLTLSFGHLAAYTIFRLQLTTNVSLALPHASAALVVTFISKIGGTPSEVLLA